MATNNNIDLFATLKQLATYVINEIESGLTIGTIQPRQEPHLCWKVEEFEYTNRGTVKCRARGEYINKQALGWRAYDVIQKSIEKSELYCYTQDILDKEFIDAPPLNSLLRKLTPNHLDEKKIDDADIDFYIRNFIKEAYGEPLKYGAKVELVGIALQPEEINFKINDLGIVLRQTKVEDIEKEFPLYGFSNTVFGPHPSAILNIEFSGGNVNEVQSNIEQAIAILRLFKVGSVGMLSYRMFSESLKDVLGSTTMISKHSTLALETYLVNKEDTSLLKEFWKTMRRTLPPNLYELGINKYDYLSIAYQRYCDALIQNGLFERRIANAVMGLESLFLKDAEMNELSYRLKIRIAKVLNLLGFDPYKVKETVKDAYEIRSKFVHGGQLSHNGKEKLKRLYGTTQTFLLLLLDYLRISILITIFERRMGKEEFIDLIDSSLIDKVKENELHDALNTSRKYNHSGITGLNN